MKKIITLFVILIILVNSPVFALVTKSGTTSAAFLNIDVGVRAVGMGGAFVALANDATAMYWNSAGIAKFSHSEASFTHCKWIADIAINYAALTFPIKNVGTIGFNATFMSMDDMKRTTLMNPDGTGEMFGAGSQAIGLAFARMLTDRFSIGANFKYISEEIYHMRAQGLAFDIGTLFDTNLNGLSIGMNISNYGTKMRLAGRDVLFQTDPDPSVSGNNSTINAELKTDAFELPLMFRVGLAMDVLKGKGNSNLFICVDALHPNDDVEYINLGAEYAFRQTVFLRCGYNKLFAIDSETGLTLGGGVESNLRGNTSIAIDYGYMDFGVLNDVQMFTIALRF